MYFFRDLARYRIEYAYGEREALRAYIAQDPGEACRAFLARLIEPARECVPLAAVRRETGRSLVCARCFDEKPAVSDACPACGRGGLFVYSEAEFPHIRIEACGVCRTYLKAIDLGLDPDAVPEVDELAAIPLDLWAAARGYRKLTPNLFGL